MLTPRQYIAAAEVVDAHGALSSDDILGPGGLSGADQQQLDALVAEAVRVAPFDLIRAAAIADA